MKPNEQRPARTDPARGEIFSNGQGKDTPKLSNRQRKILELLKYRKCSAADISIALGYSDPRSHIKRIIGRGIWIQSAWVDEPDTRYKVYWYEDPETPQPTKETTTESKEQSNFLDLFPKQYNH